jgi:hypothetical protein
MSDTLTRTDYERLTSFMRRYNLQSAGFTLAQARRLVFLRWLYDIGRLIP